MKRIEIITTFSGDPDNTGNATRRFNAETTEDVHDAYADLLVTKGLARIAAAQPAAAIPVPPSPPPSTATATAATDTSTQGAVS